MNPSWLTFGLALVIAVVQVLLWVGTWANGRNKNESSLTRDIGEMGRQLQALQHEIDHEPWSGQIVEMGKQLARIEEHFRATDREVVALTNNIEALRAWIAVLKKGHD